MFKKGHAQNKTSTNSAYDDTARDAKPATFTWISIAGTVHLYMLVGRDIHQQPLALYKQARDPLSSPNSTQEQKQLLQQPLDSILDSILYNLDCFDISLSLPVRGSPHRGKESQDPIGKTA